MASIRTYVRTYVRTFVRTYVPWHIWQTWGKVDFLAFWVVPGVGTRRYTIRPLDIGNVRGVWTGEVGVA